mgnify:CR=1 FL=1
MADIDLGPYSEVRIGEPEIDTAAALERESVVNRMLPDYYLPGASPVAMPSF